MSLLLPLLLRLVIGGLLILTGINSLHLHFSDVLVGILSLDILTDLSVSIVVMQGIVKKEVSMQGLGSFGSM